MFKDNIEQSYQDWFNKLTLDPKLDEAFEAGFRVGSLSNDDARLVVLARQEIALEQQKAKLRNMGEGIHKAKEAVLTAVGELDKLRDNSWMY